MKIASTPLFMLALAGCASNPVHIKGTYVSPSVYQHNSCDQINEERRIIAGKVQELADAQTDKANSDAVSVAVGALIFWPALFLLAVGDDREEELSALKGNYDALTQAGIVKRCFAS